MRARVGKIARLPGDVRHELNRRLNNGALGRELAKWLNELPEVKPVLATRFAGRPITEDNLSAWRRGGFKDWLQQEERRVRLRELSADDRGGSPENNARRINAVTQEQLALELAEELERLSAMKNGVERWKHLQRLSQELCRLQHAYNRRRELRLLEAQAANKGKPDQTGIGPSRAFPGLRPYGGEGTYPQMRTARIAVDKQTGKAEHSATLQNE